MGQRLKILLACEESQAVTKEFRRLGHEAYSCDILPTSGEHPEWHLQQDVEPLLKDHWDLIIAFPPCTHLAVSGAAWFEQKRLDGRQQEGIDFFMLFTDLACERVAIENPVGIMSTNYRKPDQIIQPYEFGDPYSKKTCLWLKGLPKLIPTNQVEPEPRKVYKSGNSMPQWYADAWGKSPEERSKIRSKTFPGIARAMAEQWSNPQPVDNFAQ
jgi:site-specific DNA-cytosine methylase